MKAHIFLVANPKFQLQILFSFGGIIKNVKLIGIPESSFLCIFIIASSPGVHTFFFLWRANKKLPQGETSQNAFQRSRSINWKWKIYFIKMGISTFKPKMWSNFSSKCLKLDPKKISSFKTPNLMVVHSTPGMYPLNMCIGNKNSNKKQNKQQH